MPRRRKKMMINSPEELEAFSVVEASSTA